jgi:MFS family permease
MTTPAVSHRVGPVELAPGITRSNFATLLIAAFTMLGFGVFVAVGTPYILTVNLGIPTQEQGTVTGDLVVIAELTTILVFAVAGVLADRVGRRPVFAFGMIVMGIAYLVYPFAGSLTELMLYRVVYAVGMGAASGMMLTLMADYPADNSRGKLIGFVAVLNGLGVVTSIVVLGMLPEIFVDQGFDELTAGRLAHGVVALGCFATAALGGLGFKKGTPTVLEQRPSVRELIRSGVAEARNPRIALAYVAAFVSRGDLAIVGTFGVLWGSTVALDQGIAPAEALSKGRTLFAAASIAGLVWSPVVGVFLDHVNRVTGLIVCMALASLGYFSLLLVADPFAPVSLALFAMVGIGQVSAFFGAQVLIGQEAPLKERASVVGAYNLFGAVGIVFVTGIGGRLFDAIAPVAPFVFVGCLNALVMLMAIVVRARAPGPGIGRSTESHAAETG